MRGKRPLAFVVWCLVWFLFGVLVWFACVLFPSSCCVSFPFNDDLDTPPTCVRTRGKKTAEASCLQDGPHLQAARPSMGLYLAMSWMLLKHRNGWSSQKSNSQAIGDYCTTARTLAEGAAQDYSFEALHRIYFCDAWRPEPVLGAPGSELVLPPEAGLLVHGCYWPQPRDADDILSVSEVETVDAENPHHPPNSPETTDATMPAGK